jgi:hypothetical protein
MAAQFARNVNARQLILNHFSPRYHGDDQPARYALRLCCSTNALALTLFHLSLCVVPSDDMLHIMKKHV